MLVVGQIVGPLLATRVVDELSEPGTYLRMTSSTAGGVVEHSADARPARPQPTRSFGNLWTTAALWTTAVEFAGRYSSAEQTTTPSTPGPVCAPITAPSSDTTQPVKPGIRSSSRLASSAARSGAAR